MAIGTMEEEPVFILRKCGSTKCGPETITLNGTITIGRDATVTHPIKSPFLSRRHAILRFDGNFWTIEDLQSRNGTYVNNLRVGVLSARMLLHGDQIGFGMPIETQRRDDSLVYRVCDSKKVAKSCLNIGSTAEKTQRVVPNDLELNSSKHNFVAVGEEQFSSTTVSGTVQTECRFQEVVVESARQPQPGPSSTQQELPKQKKRIPKLMLKRCDAADFALPSRIRWKVYETDLDDEGDYEPSVSECSSSTFNTSIKKENPSTMTATSFPDYEIIDLCSDDDDDDHLEGAVGGAVETNSTSDLMDHSHRVSVPLDLVQATTGTHRMALKECDPFEAGIPDDSDSDSDNEQTDFLGYSQEDEVIIVSDNEDCVVMPKRIKVEVKQEEEDEEAAYDAMYDDWAIMVRKSVRRCARRIIDDSDDEQCNEIPLKVQRRDEVVLEQMDEEDVERRVGAIHGVIEDPKEVDGSSRSSLLLSDVGESDQRSSLDANDADDTTVDVPTFYPPSQLGRDDDDTALDVPTFFPASQLGRDDDDTALDVTTFFPASQLGRDDDDTALDVTTFFPASQLGFDDSDEEEDEGEVVNPSEPTTIESDYDVPLRDLVRVNKPCCSKSLQPQNEEVRREIVKGEASNEDTMQNRVEEAAKNNVPKVKSDDGTRLSEKPHLSFYSRSDDTKGKFQLDRLKLPGKSTIVSGTGTTMLTKARPMTIGRRSTMPPLVAQKEHSHSSMRRPPKQATIIAPIAVNKRKGQKNTLKNNVLQLHGNRIRAPGGGSAIPTGWGTKPLIENNRSHSLLTRNPQREQEVRRTKEETVLRSMKVVEDPKPKAIKHTVRQKDRATRADRLAEDMILSKTDKPVAVKRKLNTQPIPTKRCMPTTSGIAAQSRLLESSIRPPNSGGSVSLPAKRVTFADAARPEKEAATSSANVQRRTDPLKPRLDISGETLNKLLNVLFWNTLWLKEQSQLSKYPPILPKRKLIKVSKKYDTKYDYAKTYFPLVLLETWECISKKWRESFGRLPEHRLVFTGMQVYEDGTDRALLINCYAVVSRSEANSEDSLQSGWLTLLRIAVKDANVQNGKKSTVNLFAYIESCRKSPYNQFQKCGVVPSLLSRAANQIAEEKTLLTIRLITKAKVLDIQKESFLEIEMLTKMRKTLHQMETMFNVTDTKLGEALMSPNEELCTLPAINLQRKLVSAGDVMYNASQRQAILRVTEACAMNPTVPKVSLIHGPPGTGKTAVVVALVTQLLYGDHIKQGSPKPYILLCAPSNNAVDEDVCRLMDQRERIRSSDPMRIVRLGQLDQVHSHVRNIHVDHLLRRYMIQCSGSIDKTIEQLQKEIKTLSADEKAARSRLEQLRQHGRMGEVGKLRLALSKLEANLGKKERECQRLKENPLEDNGLCVLKKDILLKAHVIATTLGSCSQTRMEVLTSNPNRPLICIVDEATQCVEPDLIQLLSFGITKLVLVGDPQQLPATVLSNKAKQLGYQQSLFHRLYETLNTCDPPPAIMLDVQYRMHPEIACYPSNAFYNGKLKNDLNTVKKYASVPFIPYIFFDVKDSKEEKEADSSFWNTNEVTFVVRLVETLIAKDKTLNIGIITFYSKQKQLISHLIKQSSVLKQENALKMVEINTVDSFQGREKDVIIVSAVRSTKNIGFLRSHQRLNVAITRAKSALYMCAHADSFESATHWKGLVNDALRRGKLVQVSSRVDYKVLRNFVIKTLL